MVVGNVLFPQGVSHIVLNFQPLFGSRSGGVLVEWAVSQGLGVRWSPGQFNVAAWESFLDPSVPFVKNQTIPAETVRSFKDSWQYVSAASPDPDDEEWWKQQWMQLWPQMPSALRVHNVQPGFCADTNECFGVDDDLHCLCTTARDADAITKPAQVRHAR